MSRLCQPKSDPYLPLQFPFNQVLLLLRRAKVLNHDHIGKIPHDRMLILQIIEQA